MTDKNLVLLIEDDVAVQRVTARILESFGFEVASAEDVAGGVALMGQRGNETTCVLVDYSLKSGTGVDAMNQMRAIDPDLPVIMLSGFPQQDVEASSGGNPAWSGFLQKPYSAPELKAAIETCRRA